MSQIVKTTHREALVLERPLKSIGDGRARDGCPDRGGEYKVGDDVAPRVSQLCLLRRLPIVMCNEHWNERLRGSGRWCRSTGFRRKESPLASETLQGARHGDSSLVDVDVAPPESE